MPAETLPNTALFPAPSKERLSQNEERQLFLYTLFWSVMLLFAALVADLIYGEGLSVFGSFRLLLISPSKLITDYFEIGSVASTFLNAGLCGLACNAAMFLVKAPVNATLLAGYFLVISHCFFGLNFLNMWPPFLGIAFYCLVTKTPYRDKLPLSMFATSLGPFIGDFLFRYTFGEAFAFGSGRVSLAGVLLALAFGIGSGFVIPALLPGTTKMHRGFNLYKAGLAIGLYGVLAYSFFYKTLGATAPETLTRVNPAYEAQGRSYPLFVNLFYVLMFAATGIYGFLQNERRFSGYRKVFDADGWKDDFPLQHGIPLTMLNIGIYGFAILAYMNAVVFLTEGAGFTGPTTGVVIAAITFSACGQTPKNVWPIALGYGIVAVCATLLCRLLGFPLTWSLSTQGYINGAAFATGLCPFTGKYSRRVGAAAGALSAILVSTTAAMHGGLVLYNSGFTAGLSALILLPILDFYQVKPKESNT